MRNAVLSPPSGAKPVMAGKLLADLTMGPVGHD
jgi:hypothetical protein